MNKTQRDTMATLLADLLCDLTRDDSTGVDPHDVAALEATHPKLHRDLVHALSRPPVPSHRHWDHPLLATYSDSTTGVLPLQDALIRVLRGTPGDPLASLARLP